MGSSKDRRRWAAAGSGHAQGEQQRAAAAVRRRWRPSTAPETGNGWIRGPQQQGRHLVKRQRQGEVDDEMEKALWGFTDACTCPRWRAKAGEAVTVAGGVERTRARVPAKRRTARCLKRGRSMGDALGCQQGGRWRGAWRGGDELAPVRVQRSKAWLSSTWTRRGGPAPVRPGARQNDAGGTWRRGLGSREARPWQGPTDPYRGGA